MHVIHVSAECYPIAKIGGLADVVGALPKYLQKIDVTAWVVTPKYDVSWYKNHYMEVVHTGEIQLGNLTYGFTIEKEINDTLGFPLYAVNIPGLFDRKGIYADPDSGYAYYDEFERSAGFQIAVLNWIKSFSHKPNAVHCHDHHTALIPFLMAHAHQYESLASIPTVLTIHNGEYQGRYDMSKRFLLPSFDWNATGLLEWHHELNSMAAGIRAAWKVSTVSPNYMKELIAYSSGLETLLRQEQSKCVGIINGIDDDVWNPKTDPFLAKHMHSDIETFKRESKAHLKEEFHLQDDLPLTVFIGRFAKEKGADIIPDLVLHAAYNGVLSNYIVLGTGDQELVSRFEHIRSAHFGFFNAQFEYNEGLAHRLYAGADFIFMPSRVEPCGLNQMYAMRYGTVPIVRAVGGLYDTVVDLGQPDGYGIQFWDFNLLDATNALKRATQMYNDREKLKAIREKIMHLDFSWSASANSYKSLYQELNQ